MWASSADLTEFSGTVLCVAHGERIREGLEPRFRSRYVSFSGRGRRQRLT